MTADDAETTRKPERQPDVQREAEAVARLRASLGALAADDEGFMSDVIEGETSFAEAVEGVLDQIDEDQLMLDGIRARLDDLKRREARTKKRLEARRAVIEQAMSVAEIRTLRLPSATLTLADRRPALNVADEHDIPARFFATKRALDRAALTKALAEGEAVPGATLDNAAPTLSVRRR